MGQTADQLRQEIAAKRDDDAAKIDQIEAKVQDIPQIARETVDASIQQAKASAMGSVGQMAQKIDFRQQIEARPLLALGVAVASGWLLGKLLADDASRGKGRRSRRYQRDAAPSGARLDAVQGTEAARFERAQPAAAARAGGVMEAIRGAAREAGLEDTLQAFTGALIGTVTDQLHKAIDQSFPEFGRQLRAQQESVRESRAAHPSRTYGEGGDPSLRTGSGSAYGTSGAGAMGAGASGGAGTGPGEGSGYATETAHGTGLGYGTGASAGAYTGDPSGAGGSSFGSGDAGSGSSRSSGMGG